MTTDPPAIRTVIAGRTVTRDEIRAWEAGRLRGAARKIGLSVPPGDLASQRTGFADAKLALGADEVRHRLRRDLRVTDTVAQSIARLSRGRRVTSVCDLHVAGGSAAEFVAWFTDTDRSDHARSMVAANPDHFHVETGPDGRQEVIETTGGSPLAAGFFVDYDDLTALVTPRDAASFPAEVAGVARARTGMAVGGVRHQFRDELDGFHARLIVEFPLLTAPHLIARHRWHLACEFGNWVEAAFGTRH